MYCVVVIFPVEEKIQIDKIEMVKNKGKSFKAGTDYAFCCSIQYSSAGQDFKNVG